MSTRGAPASARARQRAEILDLLAGVIAALLLVVTIAGLTGPARLLLTVAFTFFVPGRAIVTNWPRMAGWSDIAMSIALSLGVLTLFASVSLWARMWHPLGLFQSEAVASLVGLGVAFTRRRAQANEPTDRVPPRPRSRQPSAGQGPPRPDPRPDPRSAPGNRVPPRPGPRYGPAGQGSPRPSARYGPVGQAPPRPDPRSAPEDRLPPRPGPRYPQGGRVPPPPRPRPEERY
jgi:hypothetical protein